MKSLQQLASEAAERCLSMSQDEGTWESAQEYFTSEISKALDERSRPLLELLAKAADKLDGYSQELSGLPDWLSSEIRNAVSEVS